MYGAHIALSSYDIMMLFFAARAGINRKTNILKITRLTWRIRRHKIYFTIL